MAKPRAAPTPTGFVPAKTAKEAETYALQNLPGVREVSYAGVDVDVANEINKRLATMLDDNISIGVTKILPETAASEFSVENGLWFKIGRGKQKGRAAKVWKSYKETDYNFTAMHLLPQEQALSQLVTHEVGHFVYTKMHMAKVGGWKHIDDAITKKAAALERKWSALYNKATSGGGWQSLDRLPSIYSYTGGVEEGFAEVYSIYSLDKTKLPTELVDYFDELMEFVKSYK